MDGPLEGLECSERAENIINRKIMIFYIVAISMKILKIFSDLKNPQFFLSPNFFGRAKFFFGVEKKRYSYDVKNRDHSIYDVFSAF